MLQLRYLLSRFRASRFQPSRWHRDDEGQATTEYALILLAAAVVAVLVITWATAGGGAGRIGDLFDSVFDGVLDKATTPPEEP